MQLPKELGSLTDLKRREAKAFEHMAMWHDVLDDAPINLALRRWIVSLTRLH
jgi:hypothetical protein